MKKILLLFLSIIYIGISNSANAEVIAHKIYAISTSDVAISQLKENFKMDVLTIAQYEISESEIIEENATIKLNVKEYVKAKRGKRDGYVKVQIISYSVPSNGNKIIDISDRNVSGSLKLSTPKDMKEVAKNASISVVGKILEVPLFSQAIAFTKGLIKPNENQSRIKSAGTNLYKSTPLVYGEKGEEIEIEKDTYIVLKVKSHENQEDNDDIDELD